MSLLSLMEHDEDSVIDSINIVKKLRKRKSKGIFAKIRGFFTKKII